MENKNKFIRYRMMTIKSLTELAGVAMQGKADKEIIRKMYSLAGEFAQELTPYQEEVMEIYGGSKDSEYIPHIMNDLISIYRNELSPCGETCDEKGE